MKCIHCDSDTTYSVRRANGGRCGSCRHPFAFEPKTDPHKVTDGLFRRLIKDVSGDGAVFFTAPHLWYEFNRWLLRKGVAASAGGILIGVCAVGGVILSLATHTPLPLEFITVPGAVGGVAMILLARRAGPKPQPPKISGDAFRARYLDRWTATHGQIEKLLPPVQAQAAPTEKPPDVTAFSFDRAVVTDHAEAAAMLVANNFHFENNCAVLSADGYPASVAGTVMEMLRRNPQLRVFAVHDASVAGCALPLTLREARWFADPAVQVIDLGLRPRHVQGTRWITLAGDGRRLPPPLRGHLAAEEADWLERGSSVELAALRPAKLMRAIYQGFARANQGDGAADGGGGLVIWTYDGGADIYAPDSFG